MPHRPPLDATRVALAAPWTGLEVVEEIDSTNVAALGRPPGSVLAAEFQTAVWLDPRNLDALVNLSLVQRKAGQLDIAKETLLRVLNIAPRNAAAHYNLGYRKFLGCAGAQYASRAAAVRTRIEVLSRHSN